MSLHRLELAHLLDALLLMQIAHGTVGIILVAETHPALDMAINRVVRPQLTSLIALEIMSFQKIGKYGVEHEINSNLRIKYQP